MPLSSSRKGLFVVSVTVALSFVGGFVLAQDAPEPTPAPETTAPRTDVDLPTSKRTNISPAEMVDQAASYIRKMQEVLKRIVQLEEVARKQKDFIKLNCVNDKLLQVKQLMNIAESANTNLQETIARKDEEGRYHEFGRITIAHQQVTVLGTEAENCIGQDLSFVGPTEVTVDQPAEPEDPTKPDRPEIPEVEQCPFASPCS